MDSCLPWPDPAFPPVAASLVTSEPALGRRAGSSSPQRGHLRRVRVGWWLKEAIDLESKFVKFLGFMWNPLPWVMEAAAMAIAPANGGVLCDGRWTEEEAGILMPGDIVSVKLGDIIPVEARLLDGDPLKIDQSALTGESLPLTKGLGDDVYSGSTVKQGEIEAVVIAIGVQIFGKATHLVDSTNQVGHFHNVTVGTNAS